MFNKLNSIYTAALLAAASALNAIPSVNVAVTHNINDIGLVDTPEAVQHTGEAWVDTDEARELAAAAAPEVEVAATTIIVIPVENGSNGQA